MSKPKKTHANFEQGRAVAERETAAGWGGPATGASPLPLDQHHYRREYMGYGQLPQDARRQLARPGHELERLVVSVSPAQIVHTGTIQRRRGMAGKVDAYDGTPRIRAVHRFDYGLGPLVDRVADAGHEPLDTPVAHDYLHQPEGPRPDDLSKYVDAARHVPVPTGFGPGYPRLPRDHERSIFWTAGDDIIAAFDRAGL